MNAGRSRRTAIAVALAAAAIITLPSSGLAAKGTLRGTVADAPAAKMFQPAVRVYRLTPTVGAVRVPITARGVYSARVAPGLYGVVLTGWVRGKTTTAVRLVRVKSGVVTKVKALKAAGLNATAPPPIRLSVGRIQVTDPSLSYLKNALADVAISDAPFSRFDKCKMAIVEDRKYGRFKDILNEIALGKSRYADPEFRAMAIRAERNIKLYAPTARLSGTVDKAGETSSSGVVRLTDMKTGKVIWSERVNAGHVFDLPGAAMAKAVNRLCSFPATYSGTVSETDSLGGLTIAWGGTFTYTRTSSQTNPDGSRNALYTLTKASVSTFTESGICIASTSSTSPTIRFGDLEINVTPAGKWTYGFVVDTALPTAQHVCPPAPASSFTPITFLNSRTVTTALAPMNARGAISGGGPFSTPISSGSASWSLTPAG